MTKLTPVQEKAISYIQKAIVTIDELDVELPEELASELLKTQRKWVGIHEGCIEMVRGYEGDAETGEDLIYDLFRAAERGTDHKDALMLVHDRIEAGEY